MVKILVAEDEFRIRKLIVDYLENEKYQVIQAEDGEDALEKFYLNSDIDLAILDIMMPKKTGFEVLKEIRSESDLPVLILTALGNSEDEIKGLELGADDYITKPFKYKVFIARIKAALRRVNEIDEDKYQIEELVIDKKMHIARLKDENLKLSPKEYELLIYLIENKNIALKRDNILNAVWGYDFYGDPRTIDTHIKLLRSKLGDLGEKIKTVRAVGYRFEVE
ncbi:MAG: response regulator transcription factor [Senegalia sp. (in: firmicutes)]|uniref:response regulator transcription factor n=1 Tax=Senegalia sp. (in: firmicutes) TaxID=1924098 RepID=UPI003F96A43A